MQVLSQVFSSQPSTKQPSILGDIFLFLRNIYSVNRQLHSLRVNCVYTITVGRTFKFLPRFATLWNCTCFNPSSFVLNLTWLHMQSVQSRPVLTSPGCSSDTCITLLGSIYPLIFLHLQCDYVIRLIPVFAILPWKKAVFNSMISINGWANTLIFFFKP